MRVLASIFHEFGYPKELLMDNFLSFKSSEVRTFLSRCGIWPRYRCANRPSGNGIIERMHRTIKRMASRTNKEVTDVIYWYNISPREGQRTDSVPYVRMFGREPCIKHEKQSESDVRNGFLKNDRVYVKPAVPSLQEQWWEGVVTRDGKGVVVEVNNVNRHIADVRKIPTVAGDLLNPCLLYTSPSPRD